MKKLISIIIVAVIISFTGNIFASDYSFEMLGCGKMDRYNKKYGDFIGNSVLVTVPKDTALHNHPEELIVSIMDEALAFAKRQKCYSDYLRREVLIGTKKIATSICIQYASKTYSREITCKIRRVDPRYEQHLEASCEFACKTELYHLGVEGWDDDSGYKLIFWRNFARKRYEKEQKVQQKELALQEEKRLEREKADKFKNELIKKYNIQEFPSPKEFVVNPFIYEGKIIAIRVEFEEMLTSTKARMCIGFSDNIIVSGVSAEMFAGARVTTLTKRGDQFWLIGHASGKTDFRTFRTISLPHVKFIAINPYK